MNDIHFDEELDTSGLNCPMPLIKSRQNINQLDSGKVLKVISTDRGSLKDIQAWVSTDDQLELVGQLTQKSGDKDFFIHFIKKL